MESKRMPLRDRLATLHGDADAAAKQLNQMARGFELDIERLLATETIVPARRGLFGVGRPGFQTSPGVVATPAATTA